MTRMLQPLVLCNLSLFRALVLSADKVVDRFLFSRGPFVRRYAHLGDVHAKDVTGAPHPRTTSPSNHVSDIRLHDDHSPEDPGPISTFALFPWSVHGKGSVRSTLKFSEVEQYSPTR